MCFSNPSRRLIRVLHVIAMFVLANLCSAQDVDWSQTYELDATGARDHIFGVTLDGLGNIYISGTSNGAPESDEAGFQALGSKLGEQGNLIWETFGGTGDNKSGWVLVNDEFNDVYADGNGFVYFVGNVYSGAFL